MTDERFIHLHAHSHYSLLQALPKIPELVVAAAADGQDALALTDAGNLYGAIEFYKECKKRDIKPIIGVDAYVAARTRFDKEHGIDNRHARLVLLAENNTGYHNLLKLVTDAFVEGFYYKPRVDHELLTRYKDGLIAILPSFGSEISRALNAGDDERAGAQTQWYAETFGSDNVFFEITKHPEISGHDALQERIVTLASEHTVPLVAAHDVYYLAPEDRVARETLLKIQTGGAIGELSDDDPDFSFATRAQMCERFADMPAALAETARIADRCTVELSLGSWTFPKLHVENGNSYEEELRRTTYEGIARRGIEKSAEVVERIEYELSIIEQKGFSPYFLVVADLLGFAREHNILSTTRGSAAGSLVSYLNFITNIDPLEYELPFERFLNPERPKAPDIDMDFADDRRDEVIQYAKEKYGADHVAQIGTFGTMMARGVVRDVARAMGFPYETGDRIAKLIPFGMQGFPMTIERALAEVPELVALQKKEREVREIIELGKKIEGNARHISIHAAGVVIAPSPVTDFVPIQLDPKGSGKYVTQYNMHAVEDAGLLKFDFLGIRNLSILADAVARVKANHGVEIDIENIPLDDQKTFDMLARGETMGLFQLNGSGMTRYLKELKPTTIHDINAMVALYRPGPMESIPSYIERKHNPSRVTYLDERLRTILDKSRGVITYQDDVLLIAVQLAGYSWLEADKLRKAMGKKIPAEMAAQKEKLVAGLIENGMSQTKAEQMWALIEPFAAYGFNKAHAASYGKVAYQTAYMKANYPVEYMAALMTADGNDIEKVADAVTEAERLGIEVLPPDINESFGTFTVVEHPSDAAARAIRFGLYSIKNFGAGISDAIIAERERPVGEGGGTFTDLGNFLERIQDRNLTRKTLESLIKCGALDAFGERGAMLASIETLLAHNRTAAKQQGGQDSLFASMPEVAGIRLADVEPANQREKLAWEREHLGLYISGHPLDEHKEKLARVKMDIGRLKHEMHEGVQTLLVGIIEHAKPIATKSGEKMLFCTVRDYSDSIEAVVFPSIYSEHINVLVAESCVALRGRVSGRNGERSFVVDSVKSL